LNIYFFYIICSIEDKYVVSEQSTYKTELGLRKVKYCTVFSTLIEQGTTLNIVAARNLKWQILRPSKILHHSVTRVGRGDCEGMDPGPSCK
jgi:hypothetical protein